MMKFDFRCDLWRLILPFVVICIVGCGGRDPDQPSTSSTDEITAFIEENPEFGDSAKPRSKSTELGLER